MDFNEMQKKMNEEMANPAELTGERKEFARDERFYKISKDKDGNGSVKIRFLPSFNRDKSRWNTKVSKRVHNSTVIFGKNKKWMNEICPKTFNKENSCPVCDYAWKEYNELKDDGASQSELTAALQNNVRKFASKDRHITNILILEDKENPENEGKIFVFEFGKQILDVIWKAMHPSDDEISEKGLKPFNAWDLTSGKDFRLKLTAGKFTGNGFPSWENSFFASECSSIDKAEELVSSAICLDEFVDPELHLKSEEYLLGRLKVLVPSLNNTSITSENDTSTLSKVKDISDDTKPNKVKDDKSTEFGKELEKESNSDGKEVDDFFNEF